MINKKVVALKKLDFGRDDISAGQVGKLLDFSRSGDLIVDFGSGSCIVTLNQDVAFLVEPPEAISLDEEDLTELHNRIENEGFDYCFMCYSDFGHIPDKQFHRLRVQYKKAHEDLEKYLKFGNYA